MTTVQTTNGTYVGRFNCQTAHLQQSSTSVAPGATVPSAKWYSNASNFLTWYQTTPADGFQRVMDATSTALTANRTYTLFNASLIVVLLAYSQLLTNKTFSMPGCTFADGTTTTKQMTFNTNNMPTNQTFALRSYSQTSQTRIIRLQENNSYIPGYLYLATDAATVSGNSFWFGGMVHIEASLTVGHMTVRIGTTAANILVAIYQTGDGTRPRTGNPAKLINGGGGYISTTATTTTTTTQVAFHGGTITIQPGWALIMCASSAATGASIQCTSNGGANWWGPTNGNPTGEFPPNFNTTTSQSGGTPPAQFTSSSVSTNYTANYTPIVYFQV